MPHHSTCFNPQYHYHVIPQHTLRVSTSVAYRTPSLFEENANIQGATAGQVSSYVSKGGLQPERTHSREIGYLGEFSAAKMTLDLRAYDDHVSDIIFVDPAATVQGWPYSFANIYAANYRGYEGTFKFHWSEASNVIFNFSRQFVSCEITGVATNPFYVPLYLQGYIDECPLSVPNYGSSILLTQRFSADVEGSAGYYHQDGIKMIAGIPQSMMNRIDLRIAQSFGKSGRPGSGDVALVVQNALQDNYTKFSNKSETNDIQFQRRAYIYATYYY